MEKTAYFTGCALIPLRGEEYGSSDPGSGDIVDGRRIASSFGYF